ncbi:MAG: hypothetical protein ACHQF2_11065 [Flavobacteriales bacterium]
MKLHSSHILICLVACFFIASCNSEKGQDKPAAQKMMCDSLFGKKNKDFRMVSFGDLRENIPLGDGPTIMENEADRLVEKISLNNADSTYAEVFYLFTENRLSEAEINVITKSDSLLNIITDSLTRALTHKFGKPVQEGGFTYWSGKSAGGYSVEIYLSNRTDEFRLPTLQIILRAELIETPRMAFAY